MGEDGVSKEGKEAQWKEEGCKGVTLRCFLHRQGCARSASHYHCSRRFRETFRGKLSAISQKKVAPAIGPPRSPHSQPHVSS